MFFVTLNLSNLCPGGLGRATQNVTLIREASYHVRIAFLLFIIQYIPFVNHLKCLCIFSLFQTINKDVKTAHDLDSFHPLTRHLSLTRSSSIYHSDLLEKYNCQLASVPFLQQIKLKIGAL